MLPIYFITFVAVLLLWFYLWATRKQRRRKKILSKPFLEEWKTILNDKVAFYHTLEADQKIRFEQLIQIFLAEKRIVGIKTDIDDEIRVLVAASAIIPVFGFKNWEFDTMGEVFVTDGVLETLQIDESHQNMVLGKVQPMFGNTYFMTLSKQSLLQGFDSLDGQNVGIHEFAHILDEADGSIDGVAQNLIPPHLVEEWVAVSDKITKMIEQGKSSINPYAATNRAEFFAVTTEYFFEEPQKLAKEHPELYHLLSQTYQQNPKKTFQIDFKKLLNPYGKRTQRNAPCPCGSGKKYKRCCLAKN